VPISSRSPWQNCYAERMIGSIRRECLNHAIVINGWHLRRILKATLVITVDRGRICHWIRMLQNPVQCRIYRLGGSFKFIKWADCIIGTSALLLDTLRSPRNRILAKDRLES
jgi:hypothetical protein